ncbi:MAG: PAS domain-containing protein [Sphingomonas sp.]|uniref:ATP-binding protein n=1 Tax=Sphingomonas sp. TaxID=28214 RepID=UPI001AFF4BC0|nr:ATP-binding protein [Sphingomonas sp.]MBO9621716.1 PAS domain-containing protein [Sphingomonas sp.]
MRFRDLSLASRPLILLVWTGSLLLLAALAVASTLQLRAERLRAEEAAIRENQNRAIAFEQFVTRTFEAAEVAAEHLTLRYGQNLDSQPLLQRIDDPLAANPLFTGISIADARGNIHWTSFPDAVTRNIARYPAFQAVRDAPPGASLLVDRPLALRGKGHTVIPLSHPIRARDGSFAGMVSLMIPVEAFTDFNHGAQLRPLDMISVIRADGITLARRTGSRVSWGEDLRGRLVMEHQATDPNGTYLGPSSIDGIRRYFSHRRIARYGVFVTVGLGYDDALRGLTGRRHWHWAALALLAATVIAFSAALTWGLKRRDRGVQALGESNDRLREAQRLGRIGDWEYDLKTERFFWSDQLCQLYGRDVADDVQQRDQVLACLEPDSREELARAIDAARATGEPQQCEVMVQRADGDEACHRIRITAVRGAEGTVERLFATEQDITAEKLHERLRDEVAQIARVEAVNLMGATVAHELSQPLTAASNYVAAAHALAVRQAPGDAGLVVERLEEAERHIGFTRNIVQRVRDMVSDRTDSTDSAPVLDIVEDAIALAWLAAPGWKGEIAQRLDVAAPRVAADKIQVQQVLLNLLRNACEAAALAAEPRVTVSTTAKTSDAVTFAIDDNGPGIAPELGDIFSPFASSKRDGLGLGLAVSRAIVQSYGGRMWIDHAHAGGARICFTLPLEG